MAKYKIQVDGVDYVVKPDVYQPQYRNVMYSVMKIYQVNNAGVKNGLAVTVLDSTFDDKKKQFTPVSKRFVPFILEIFIDGKSADIVYDFDYDTTDPRLDTNVVPVGKLTNVFIDGKHKTGKDLDYFKTEGKFYYKKATDLLQKICHDYIDIVCDCLGIANEKATQDLLAACKTGDVIKATINAKSGGDVNAKNKDGYPLLIWMAFSGNTPIAEVLIEAGADVNAKDQHGNTALYYAAFYGHTKIVDALIKAKADVNATNNGFPALYAAAEQGHTKIVDMLIKAGAYVDAMTSNDGKTALMEAAFNGHTEIVKLLIDAKAIMDIPNRINSSTALMWAAKRGHTEIVKLLIGAGADVNQHNDDGKTAFDVADNEQIKQLLRVAMNNKKTSGINYSRLNSGRW